MNKYAITIDVESEYPADVILKNVRDVLEQYYKHTHNDWVKDYRIEQTGTVELEEPDEPKALLLWEILNGWYWEVANAAGRCALKVIETGKPLTEDDLFEVGASMYADERQGAMPAPVYAGWRETVQTAYEALRILNGDVPGQLEEQFQSWVDEGYGPVGNLVETAHLFLFATGPMPAKRHEYTKES